MTNQNEQPLVLALRGVHKSFDGHAVLDGIDLEVKRRERVALIGPSGAGKSTVLRLIVGLERPERGRVELFGVPSFDAQTGVATPPRRGAVGMVFQHFNLFPHMTVLDNVTEAPRSVLGLPRDVAATRALSLLTQVGLAERAAAKPGQLSGGQRQRVAIARALAMEPEIMLFDEVTSALDPEAVGGVLSLLRDLSERMGMTILIVTHHMALARELADRVVFLADGKVIEQGPPGTLLSSPKSPRLSDFLRALLE